MKKLLALTLFCIISLLTLSARAVDVCYNSCGLCGHGQADPCTTACPGGYCSWSPDPNDRISFYQGSATDIYQCPWSCDYCPNGNACTHVGAHASYNGWVCEGIAYADPPGNVPNSCIPITCANYIDGQCGPLPDSCGGTINCNCGSGQTCISGLCQNSCTPKACVNYGVNACGNLPDGCGGTLDCTCPAGDVCTSSNVCCSSTPPPPPSCTNACGIVTTGTPGCADSVDCGPCKNGFVCESNKCVSVPKTPALGSMSGLPGIGLLAAAFSVAMILSIGRRKPS